MKHNPPRVMWLLNKTALRRFEMEQLKVAGISQIFLPKFFPYDEENLSSTVTVEFDESLEISPEQLDFLNKQDWYGSPSAEAWDLANKSFDILFVGFSPGILYSALKNFKGAIVLRTLGLGREGNYADLINSLRDTSLYSAIKKCGKRFFLLAPYDYLMDNESAVLKSRSVLLPIGLSWNNFDPTWEGGNSQIYFICPHIGLSSDCNKVYRDFVEDFHDFNYIIGGEQPIDVGDERVIKNTTDALHKENMQKCRVMFYHSREVNNIHQHPFEAIQAGMPLVFMANGMLDAMGGIGLPGRCKSIKDAREKIARILRNDKKLIDEIRSSQSVLLDAVRPEICQRSWQAGFHHIVQSLAISQAEECARPTKKSVAKVAVILPIACRGGSFRGAKLLAEAIYTGSRQSEEPADVVFAYNEDAPDSDSYSESEFEDLSAAIARRSFHWKVLSASEARRAMQYAGFDGWEPRADEYMVPDDGINQLQDCNIWVIVSDRLVMPILPLRPIVLLVFDYLQRYENSLNLGDLGKLGKSFLNAARSADRVLVTTSFTWQDATQYAGLPVDKVRKLPMLVPNFSLPSIRHEVDVFSERSLYFVWATNVGPQKNHAHAAEALRVYYEELSGKLKCHVCGVNSKDLLSKKNKYSHLKKMTEIFSDSKILQTKVVWSGELSDIEYRKLLISAKFLWHPGRIDNGTFCVVEAAQLGIPSLSSDYPAMQEINSQFQVNLAWMDPTNPREMAQKLKFMELMASERRQLLPSAQDHAKQSATAHAKCYWEEIRACL